MIYITWDDNGTISGRYDVRNAEAQNWLRIVLLGRLLFLDTQSSDFIVRMVRKVNKVSVILLHVSLKWCILFCRLNG
jgi:hypothetical protein